jgi:uncharacterized membrane protein YhfC
MTTVPSLSILFMAVSGILSIGVPIGLLIYFHKKYGAKIVPALVGAAAFIVFAMVLERLMHMAVLKPSADGKIALASQPLLFMLYGGFAAGIFEETGRFVSFHLLKKKYGGVKTALSYGVGHGGIEAILIGGVSMIMNLVYSAMINSGATESLVSGPNGALLATQLQALSMTPSSMFLIGGLERMFTLAIHISLSVIVFYSVYRPRKVWLFPLAIVLHAIIDFAPALMQSGAISNVLVVEALVLLFAALLVALAVYTHRRLKPSVESPSSAQGDGGTHEQV